MRPTPPCSDVQAAAGELPSLVSFGRSAEVLGDIAQPGVELAAWQRGPTPPGLKVWRHGPSMHCRPVDWPSRPTRPLPP